MSVQHWSKNDLHVIYCQSLSTSIRIVILYRLLILAELVTIFISFPNKALLLVTDLLSDFMLNSSNLTNIAWAIILFTLLSVFFTLPVLLLLPVALYVSLVSVHLLFCQLAGWSFHLCALTSFLQGMNSRLSLSSLGFFHLDFCCSPFVLWIVSLLFFTLDFSFDVKDIYDFVTESNDFFHST